MKSGVVVARDAIDPCDEWQSHARATYNKGSTFSSRIDNTLSNRGCVGAEQLPVPSSEPLLIYASQPPIEICIKTFAGRSTLANQFNSVSKRVLPHRAFSKKEKIGRKSNDAREILFSVLRFPSGLISGKVDGWIENRRKVKSLNLNLRNLRLRID